MNAIKLRICARLLAEALHGYRLAEDYLRELRDRHDQDDEAVMREVLADARSVLEPWGMCSPGDPVPGSIAGMRSQFAAGLWSLACYCDRPPNKLERRVRDCLDDDEVVDELVMEIGANLKAINPTFW